MARGGRHCGKEKTGSTKEEGREEEFVGSKIADVQLLFVIMGTGSGEGGRPARGEARCTSRAGRRVEGSR